MVNSQRDAVIMGGGGERASTGGVKKVEMSMKLHTDAFFYFISFSIMNTSNTSQKTESPTCRCVLARSIQRTEC